MQKDNKTRCECVTDYFMNGDPDREVSLADKDCPLCDGDGWQKREHPICADCGEDERCEHGGCFIFGCENACFECIKRKWLDHEAEAEAAFQRDIVGPLLGLDQEEE